MPELPQDMIDRYIARLRSGEISLGDVPPEYRAASREVCMVALESVSGGHLAQVPPGMRDMDMAYEFLARGRGHLKDATDAGLDANRLTEMLMGDFF